MNHQHTNESTLRALRALVPKRRLTYSESLRIAELQANRLLELFDIAGPTVPSELITELPHVEVRLMPDLPVSGSAHWEAGRWIITLNAAEPYVRRRFSLVHEFKHILDHHDTERLYGDVARDEGAAIRAERVADHFAACVLMPKRWLKSQWFQSGQRLEPLARTLHVSTRALAVRLWHLGIAPETPRCPRTTQPYSRPRDRATDLRYTPLTGAAA